MTRIGKQFGYSGALVFLLLVAFGCSKESLISQERMMPTEPVVESRIAQPYAYVECDASDGDVGKVAPPRIEDLAAWLGKQGVEPAGPPFFNYTAMGPGPSLHIQVAFPLKVAVKSEGNFKSGLLPAGRYVSLRHLGHYDQLKAANMRLFEWAEKNGYKLEGHSDGQVFRCKARYESYVTDPGQVKDPAKFETDVVFLAQD